MADILPIPKCKKPTYSDFRPISLLPIPGKILEKIIFEKERRNLLSTYDKWQFAYRPGGSTTAALVTIHDKVTELLDQKDCTGVSLATVDLSKAFDRVPHGQLIEYLRNKTSYVFLHWLSGYLSDRCFRVIYSGNYSTTRVITSGVPQGSILGPYLFASYMSDVQPSTDNVWYVKYADDVTVIQPLSSSVHDAIISNELSHIRDCVTTKGLSLNERKTKRIIFSKRNLPAVPIIPCDHSLKILGVIFTCDLRWNNHIDAIVKLCSSRLHLLRVLKSIVNKQELIVVYKSLIVSVLTYAAPVFVGLSSELSKRVEKVQRRAHRIICGSRCLCSMFPPIHEILFQQAVQLLRTAEESQFHPLHRLVPQRLPNTRRFRQPSANTDRRLKSFVPFISCALNVGHV